MAISEIKKNVRPKLTPVFEKEYKTPANAMVTNIKDFFVSLERKGLHACGFLMCTYLELPNKKTSFKHKLSILVDKETEETRTYEEHITLNVTVKGSYKQLEQGYYKINEYIEQNEVAVTGSPYEIYLNGPKFGFLPIGLVSEIHMPIKEKIE